MKPKKTDTAITMAKLTVMCISTVYMVAGILSIGNADADLATKGKLVTETSSIANEPTENITEEQSENHRSLVMSRDWGDRDSYLLAKIAMAEAEGEDIEGKALVIMVVLNRVWSDGFPDSIEAVIFQEGQFTPISNGRWANVEPNQECYDAVQMVMNGWDQSLGATFFEAKGDSTWHQTHLAFLFQHGGHYFYKEKEGK